MHDENPSRSWTARVLPRWLVPTWRIEGWDTYSNHAYPLPGRFWTEAQARRAAQRHLRTLERQQPTKTSGGQSGIQDQVVVISPEGKRQRVIISD